jgi:iron complex transport system permease protein
MTRATIVFSVVLGALIPLSLVSGRVWVAPFDSLSASLILWELRLPRTILAISIGAGLGAAGAVMQGYLRNPLADPGLFGIAPMAALGAVASFWFDTNSNPITLPLMSVGGAAIGMALLSIIAGKTGGIALFTLAGLMIASLAGSLTALMITLSPSAFAISEIVIWLNGALTDRSWLEVQIALPLIALGTLLFFFSSKGLDALTLGTVTARSLGIRMDFVLLLLICGSGLVIGASVAVAGIIGFVGLIVPHLVRPLTNYMPSSLIIPSALAGACLLLAADIFVRILPLNTELRLGIALSLIGAPFFLLLLMRMRRERV